MGGCLCNGVLGCGCAGGRLLLFVHRVQEVVEGVGQVDEPAATHGWDGGLVCKGWVHGCWRRWWGCACPEWRGPGDGWAGAWWDWRRCVLLPGRG